MAALEEQQALALALALATAVSPADEAAAEAAFAAMVAAGGPTVKLADGVFAADSKAARAAASMTAAVGAQKLVELAAAAPRSAAAAQPRSLRIAFLGNSLTYYNDLPHLVQHIIALNCNTGGGAKELTATVGACLRGGQSLPSLFATGGDYDRPNKCIGSRDMYSTVAELLSAPGGWDYVVCGDHTQGPARGDYQPAKVASCTPVEISRGRTIASLESEYAPLFLKAGATVVLFQTWGYFKDTKKSEEIGGFEEMSAKLAEGYGAYAAALRACDVPVLTAPVGDAFRKAHMADRALWGEMYQHDGFHPKALGSFLAASHICATILADRWKPPAGTYISLPAAWPAGVPTYAAADGIPQPQPAPASLAHIIETAGPTAGRAGPIGCVMRQATPSGPLCEAAWFEAQLWKTRTKHDRHDWQHPTMHPQ